MSELSWTPKREGAVYCSPACGNGCKWVDYKLASHKASKLAGRLGAGWKPRVWENLGWHWEVQNVHWIVRRPHVYSVEFRGEGLQFFAESKSLLVALEMARTKALTHAAAMAISAKVICAAVEEVFHG